MTATTLLDPSLGTDLRISQNLRETHFTVPSNTKKEPTVKVSSLVQALTISIPLLAVVLTLFAFFYTSLLPDKVGSVIESSKYLSEKFADSKNGISDVKKQVEDLKRDLDSLKSAVLNLKDPKTVLNSITKAASGDNASLAQELPPLRQSIRVFRETIRESSSAKLPEHAYQEPSAALLKKYSNASPSLKHEIRLTLKELATAKSYTDGLAKPLTKAERDHARRLGKLFDHDTDLSLHKTWSGAIFTDCRLTVSHPEQTLHLVHARFINVDFSSLPENQTSNNLVAALVTHEATEITRKVVTASPEAVDGNTFKVILTYTCCLPLEDAKPESGPEPLPSPTPTTSPKQVSFLQRRH